MNKLEKEQFWFKHYEQFKSTKMTQPAYAESHMLKFSQFKNWVRKFRHLERGTPGSVIAKKGLSSHPGSLFLPITVRSRDSERSAIALKVVLHDLVLEFSELPEASWLMQLSQAAGAR